MGQSLAKMKGKLNIQLVLQTIALMNHIHLSQMAVNKMRINNLIIK